MKIAVAGTGYVGLSLATLLSQNNEVIAVDILADKVNMINRKQSPIKDAEISEFLATKNLNLLATTDQNSAYKYAEFIIIATPTNYDVETNSFDTSAVESVIEDVLKINPDATMVIKSTIPVGYTESIKQKYSTENIMFSPEFYVKEKHYLIIYIHLE